MGELKKKEEENNLVNLIKQPNYPIIDISEKKCKGIEKLGRGNCQLPVFQNIHTGDEYCYECFIAIVNNLKLEIKTCPAIVDGNHCNGEISSRLLCEKHYTQLRRNKKIKNKEIYISRGK